MSPHAPGRMAHGSCLFPGAERRSKVTLKVLASTGESVMVPDIRLLVEPVGDRLAVNVRPGAVAPAGAPAAVGAALELVELEAQAASAIETMVSAASDCARMCGSPIEEMCADVIGPQRAVQVWAFLDAMRREPAFYGTRIRPSISSSAAKESAGDVARDCGVRPQKVEWRHTTSRSSRATPARFR